MAFPTKCRKCGHTDPAGIRRCPQCQHKNRRIKDKDPMSWLVPHKRAAVVQVVEQTLADRGLLTTSGAKLDTKELATLVAHGITAKIAEIRKAAEPQVVEVRQDSGKPTIIKGAHYLFARLCRLLRAGFHVYLWGPPGSGKTTAALMACEALKIKGLVDTLDRTTFRSMIQGHMTPKGEPVHTVWTQCVIEGHGYIGDEVDNSPGYVQTLYNSALANGLAALAWGNFTLHKKMLFIGTGNTPGRPTRMFPDRVPMSAAFADRLYFMYWPLDPAIEARAAGLPFDPYVEPTAPQVTPEQWVKWVVGVRQWAAVNCPTLMVTPRASLAGLKALRAGEHPMMVADGLIFRGADEDIRTKVLNAVRLV